MAVFFKVISDFTVSRLFKEIWCTYSKCSKMVSFCRTDLKKKLERLLQDTITQKNFFWKKNTKYQDIWCQNHKFVCFNSLHIPGCKVPFLNNINYFYPSKKHVSVCQIRSKTFWIYSQKKIDIFSCPNHAYTTSRTLWNQMLRFILWTVVALFASMNAPYNKARSYRQTRQQQSKE